VRDVFYRFSPDDFLGLIAIVGTALVFLICFVAYQWRRVRVAEMEATLKQDMIQKGMAAEEIQKILRAGEKPTKPMDTSSAGLAAHMAAYSYDADDIQRVLKAIGDRGRSLTPEEMRSVRKMVTDWADGSAIEAAIRAIPRQIHVVEAVRR